MYTNSFFSKVPVCVAALAATLMLLCAPAYAGWHEWSQVSRNQAIADETAYWDTGDYGGQCKQWVQLDIVPDASGLSGLIPTNNTNVCYWNYGPYVVGRAGYIEDADPGEIVQMRLDGGGPHTFVIIGVATNGFYVAESNWCSGNCELVGFRYIDFDDFYADVECFTIYYVL